jgi:hypothetical protein
MTHLSVVLSLGLERPIAADGRLLIEERRRRFTIHGTQDKEQVR